MLIYSLRLLLLSNAVGLRRDKFILYSRVAITILVYFLFFIFSFYIIDFALHIMNSNMTLLETYNLMFDNPGNNSGGEAGSSGGNPNPNNGGQDPNNGGQGPNNDTPSYNSEEDKKRIKDWMRGRLSRHNYDQASSVPYQTQMGDKFTPAEHEYVVEQIMDYCDKQDNPAVTRYYKDRIVGEYPDRRYNGKISFKFIDKFFPS